MTRRDDAPSTVDLRALELAPGEARELSLPVPVGDVVIGEQAYCAEPPEPVARVEVSQSASGWHFRVRARADLVGACWRCLEPARVALAADTRDFQAFGRPAGAPYDEDLDCEYLEGEVLDAGAMARDALIDLLPATILCRPDCAGLCPTCGTDLNVGTCDCPADLPDARWDALREVAERLRHDP